MEQEGVTGYRVAIRYKNGNAEIIYAQEFELDLDEDSLIKMPKAEKRIFTLLPTR